MDSIQVLKPGWRALDANGNPYPGAVLYFYDAGTTNAREVFANYDLDTSLGTEVECDAGGYPTSDGNAKVEIYTGASPYKVVLKDADGATVWTHDNIVGALDTSGFLTDPDIVPSTPIVNSASNQAPAAADKGTFYNINCSGGDVTVTLDSASDLGDGWFIKVRHDGIANAVRLVTTGGELMKIGHHAGLPAFALARRGQTVTVTCDGVGFKVEESSPALYGTTGIILVADRLAVAPVSTEAGARYIATASDDWGALSVGEHDIVEADGQGGWFKITPPTDCGWTAYVQDEDDFYVFKGSAWATLGAALLAIPENVATQEQMEAASAANLIVSPGRQQYHPGHAKAWAFVLQGTTAIITDFGVASVSDDNVGRYTLTFDSAFSSANAYTCTGAFTRGVSTGTVVGFAGSAQGKSASTFALSAADVVGGFVDSQECGCAFMGDK